MKFLVSTAQDVSAKTPVAPPSPRIGYADTLPQTGQPWALKNEAQEDMVTGTIIDVDPVTGFFCTRAAVYHFEVLPE